MSRWIAVYLRRRRTKSPQAARRAGTVDNAVDEAAIARRVEFELNPSVSAVGKSEQSSLYDDACEVKNMYEAGQISSVDQGVDWLQTQGKSSYARAASVEQLAHKLSKLNENPSLVGSVEITGDSLCRVLP